MSWLGLVSNRSGEVVVVNSYDAMLRAVAAAREVDGVCLVQVTTELVQTVAVHHATDDDDAIVRAIDLVSPPDEQGLWRPTHCYEGEICE